MFPTKVYLAFLISSYTIGVRSTPFARMLSTNIMQRIQIETFRIIIGFVLLISLPFPIVWYFSLVVGRHSQRGTVKSNGTNVQPSDDT